MGIGQKGINSFDTTTDLASCNDDLVSSTVQ